jgi:hypothetical protein
LARTCGHERFYAPYISGYVRTTIAHGVDIANCYRTYSKTIIDV